MLSVCKSFRPTVLSVRGAPKDAFFNISPLQLLPFSALLLSVRGAPKRVLMSVHCFLFPFALLLSGDDPALTLMSVDKGPALGLMSVDKGPALGFLMSVGPPASFHFPIFSSSLRILSSWLPKKGLGLGFRV